MLKFQLSLRSIPPITSTGCQSNRRVSSIDPVRFRTRRVSHEEKSFKSSPIKKQKETKSTLTLERLLAEGRKKLEEIKEELKTNTSNWLLDEYTKVEDLIWQIKNQMAGRRKR